MTDKRKRRSTGGGLGLPTILLIIFIILKLTKVIDWSWLWVLSPLWISASLAVLFLIFVGMILLFAMIGILGASSGIVLGIKSWFGKQDQTDSFEEENETNY